MHVPQQKDKSVESTKQIEVLINHCAMR